MNIYQHKNDINSIQVDYHPNGNGFIELYIRDFTDDSSTLTMISYAQWAVSAYIYVMTSYFLTAFED